MQALKSLDILESSLRKDIAAHGDDPQQPLAQKRRLDPLARSDLAAAEDAMAVVPAVQAAAAEGLESRSEERYSIEDKQVLKDRHDQVATCLDSTLWLLAEVASRSRAISLVVVQAKALQAISQSSEWILRADKLSQNRRLFDDQQLREGAPPLFRIRASTAGRVISLLRLCLSLMQAGQGQQDVAADVVKMLMEHQQTVRYIYSETVDALRRI